MNKKSWNMSKIGHIIVLVIFLTGYYPQIFGQSNEATVKLSLGITEAALIKINATALSLQLKPRDAGLSLETSTADSKVGS